MKTKERKPIVLAVDDHEANLIALEAVLGADYHLITASSGIEALEILRKDANVDVILMDIQMPEIDGFQAASEIKKIPEAKDIPIIFITAVYKEEPFVKRGYEAGGIDYFSKPFDPEILKMKVGIYASFRHRADILKLKERQLRDTEELLSVGRKLSGVLENLPVGVLISDVDGRICQINDQVSRICKQDQPTDPDSYGEMLGWWDREGKMLSHNGPLAKALHEGEATHSQRIQLACKNGSQREVLCSASPLLGLDGHIVGAVVVLQDVSATKQIEADLEERITKVVSAGFELEESISH